MQEAWPVAERGGQAADRAQLRPQRPQRSRIHCVRHEPGLQRNVVTGHPLAQKVRQRPRQTVGVNCAVDAYASLTELRLGLWQRAGRLPGCDHLTRLNFGAFHVGLVEGMNAHTPAGHCHCEFPQEALRAQVIPVLERQAQHGMTGLFQRVHGCVLALVTLQLQLHEQTIRAIRLRISKGLARNWQDARAILARALRDELFDPVAKAGELRRAEER